jgi:hypothetical protein
MHKMQVESLSLSRAKKQFRVKIMLFRTVIYLMASGTVFVDKNGLMVCKAVFL